MSKSSLLTIARWCFCIKNLSNSPRFLTCFTEDRSAIKVFWSRTSSTYFSFLSILFVEYCQKSSIIRLLNLIFCNFTYELSLYVLENLKNLHFLHRLLAFARETTTSSTQKKIVGKFNKKLSHFSIGCDKMTTDNT